VKRAFVSCIVYRSFVSCIVCSYFVLCFRNKPQCATIDLEVPILHGAWPSQSLHNVVTDPGSFKLTDVSYRLFVFRFPFVWVKLPEAFVYIHVDVTHVDDFLFICP
jgi:hypothetical protein